jgi:acyl carrier protein
MFMMGMETTGIGSVPTEMRMTTEQQVRDYLVQNFLFGDDQGLSSAQSLLGSGVIDSTGVMELVMFLQKTFDIEIADQDLVPENLDTIENIRRFVEGKLAGRPARSGA